MEKILQLPKHYTCMLITPCSVVLFHLKALKNIIIYILYINKRFSWLDPNLQIGARDTQCQKYDTLRRVGTLVGFY